MKRQPAICRTGWAVSHKGKIHEGLHDAIIPQEIWDAVQEKLQNQAPHPRGRKKLQHQNLLTGLLFDADRNPYTPVFTNKKGKQYRYYLNDKLNQQKDHPNKLRARLPAHELEKTVEQALRKELLTADRISIALGLGQEENRHAIAHIIGNQQKLSFRNMVKAIEHIIVTLDSLIINVRSRKLSVLISEELDLGLPLPVSNMTHGIMAPYQTRRAKDGAIIVETKRDGSDPFDLPLPELKQLVQGVVWRDEHFGGMTIQEIAAREQMDPSKVGKIIRSGFDILSTTQ